MNESFQKPDKICDEKVLDEIKEDYINGETKTLLYKKYGLKYNIDKFSFMKIIQNIDQELGHIKSKISNNDDWTVDSKMQMNLEPEYSSSTYINK